MRNWKPFLFLPLWSWEGPLSHPGLSQPWSRPFCWKFPWHVLLSSSLWCFQRIFPYFQQIILIHFFRHLSFLPFAFVSTFLFVLGKGGHVCQPSLAGSVPLSSWKSLFPPFLCYFSPSSRHLSVEMCVKYSFKICMPISS